MMMMNFKPLAIAAALTCGIAESNDLYNFAKSGTQPPTTQYVMGDTARITSEWPLVWVNRCADIFNTGSCPGNSRVYKGNYYHGIVTHNGKEVRPQFTTVKKADACTRINAARATNVPESFINNIANLYGIDKVERDVMAADPADYYTPVTNNGIERYFLVDTCVLYPRVSSSPSGIFFDYEVHDRRTVQELEWLAQRLKLANRNRTIVFYTNSLYNPATRNNNSTTDAGIAALKRHVDIIAPIVYSGATTGNLFREIKPRPRSQSPVDDFLNSLNIIGEPMYLPVLSLYDTSISEVIQMRQSVVNPRFGVWRNYQKFEDNLPLINCMAGITCQ